ncbi:MAG TPA: DedA family protein [Alphaproteobacteria bacterium]|nr:DedA family protein [Alphaproteobacteria bacterium]
MDILNTLAGWWEGFLSLFQFPDVSWLIETYGSWFYLITFVWTFLEGETFVLFAAMAAQRGVLDPFILCGVAWIGSFCGDQLYFYIGRRYGDRMMSRSPKMRAGMSIALAWLKRYDTAFILTYRFLYGVRSFSSFAMGISDLSWGRFLVLNFLSAGIWAVTFVAVGYFFGQAVHHVVEDAGRALTFGIVGLVALVIAIRVLSKRKARRALNPAE